MGKMADWFRRTLFGRSGPSPTEEAKAYAKEQRRYDDGFYEDGRVTHVFHSSPTVGSHTPEESSALKSVIAAEKSLSPEQQASERERQERWEQSRAAGKEELDSAPGMKGPSKDGVSY